MTTDRTTKLLLALIAAGLFLNASIQLWTPASVQAQLSVPPTCTGELKANAWGGIKETIGGYDITLKCR